MSKRKAFVVFVLARLGIYLIGLVSSLLIKHGEVAVEAYRVQERSSPVAFALLKPFLFYDADFFAELMSSSYSYGKHSVFFPGYPALVRAIFEASEALFGRAEQRFLGLVATGVAANLLLQWLSYLLFSAFVSSSFGSSSLEKRSADLFLLVNPLGIYFTALYSESLFFFIQVAGLSVIYSSVRRGPLSLPSFALSVAILSTGGFVRSNGFLSIGYPIYFRLRGHSSSLQTLLKQAPLIFATILFSALPFVLVSIRSFRDLCPSSQFQYCKNGPFAFYSFFQKRDWQVAFGSFSGNRSPLYAVYALPCLMILLSFYGQNLRRKADFRQLFDLLLLPKAPLASPTASGADLVVPDIWLSLLMLFMGVAMVHFNSITRLFSGFPFFFMFLGEVYAKSADFGRKLLRFWALAFQAFSVVVVVNNYMSL